MGRRPAPRQIMHASRLTFIGLVLGLALVSCRARQVPITLASDPPGAEVWINGTESGFATPCRISLDRKRDHEVELRLPGHRPAKRRLVENGEREAIFWREMSVGQKAWNFPLFLNIHDFFAPAPVVHPLVPGRVFVRLRREADEG